MTRPTISIIWPYWERFAATQAGLVDMARRYPDEALEVLIVDDGSPREPAAGLADFPAPWPIEVITLPRKEVPKNPCTPINVGARAARGELLLLTNPETTHRAPILEALRDETLRAPRRWVVAAAWCPEHEAWHCHSREAPAGYHFCAMIRRQELLDLGGFDERYREGACYDDADLLARLRQAGFDVVFRDDLVVDHHKTGATIDWPPAGVERNRALFHATWGGPRTLEREAQLVNLPPAPPAPAPAPPPAPPAGRPRRLWTIARGLVSQVGIAQAAARQVFAPPPPPPVPDRRSTVLQVHLREQVGSAALLGALRLPEPWRSLGDRSWDLRRQVLDGPEPLEQADVVHLHGLDLWEGLRGRLAGRRVVVSIHGDWDGLVRPLPPDHPPLVVSSPELLELFPEATFVPDPRPGEAPPPVAPGRPSVIHPRGHRGGDLPAFEAFAAAAGLRRYVARATASRPDFAREALLLGHFDLTWLSPELFGLRLLGAALAAGSIPILPLGPAARAGLASLIPAPLLAQLPGPASELAAWAVALTGDRARLAELRAGLRDAWQAAWRPEAVAARLVAVYARA